MLTYLQRLAGERDALTGSATQLADKAAAEDRDLSATEQDSMRSWQARCAEIDGQLTEYNTQAESARAYATLRAELDKPEPTLERRSAELELERRTVGADWGERFLASDAFRNYPGSGTSRRLEVPFELEQRAAISLGDTLGQLPYTYTPAQYAYASPLLDVVGKVTTSANAIQWIQWAPNPQTAPGVTAEGALKPEADMTPTVVSDSLDTYAHFKSATRQVLEDLPQIRSTIENRLRQGLVVALEGAVSAALAAAPVPPVTGSAAGNDTLLGTIRQGVAAVQAAGYGAPNAVLLNPTDWADLDVATIGNAGGASGQNGFWGMRAVAVPSLPAGTAYVGNFATAVQLFTRGSAELFMTDSHADFMLRNLLLILAEIRAVATVPDPAAAAKCTVGA